MTKRELEHSVAESICNILKEDAGDMHVEGPNNLGLDGDNQLTLHLDEIGSFTITVNKLN